MPRISIVGDISEHPASDALEIFVGSQTILSGEVFNDDEETDRRDLSNAELEIVVEFYTASARVDRSGDEPSLKISDFILDPDIPPRVMSGSLAAPGEHIAIAANQGEEADSDRGRFSWTIPADLYPAKKNPAPDITEDVPVGIAFLIMKEPAEKPTQIAQERFLIIFRRGTPDGN